MYTHVEWRNVGALLKGQLILFLKSCTINTSKLSMSLYHSFSHTFQSPPFSRSCVWEWQCLHTTGAQAGCPGNLLAPAHSGKKKPGLQLWIAAVTRLAQALSLFYRHTLTHRKPTRSLVARESHSDLVSASYIKYILVQYGGLGCWGWMALV